MKGMQKPAHGIIRLSAFTALLFCLSACDDPWNCAKEGERFSAVYSEYPEGCCGELTAWESGMDTRISVGNTCYETGFLSGSPVGTCINCGNGVCEELEDVCNCEADCSGGMNSLYADAEEFCAKSWNDTWAEECDMWSINEYRKYPICELCPRTTSRK